MTSAAAPTRSSPARAAEGPAVIPARINRDAMNLTWPPSGLRLMFAAADYPQVRLDLQLDVFVSTGFDLSGAGGAGGAGGGGDGSETAAFARGLVPDVIYRFDRGFVDF